MSSCGTPNKRYYQLEVRWLFGAPDSDLRSLWEELGRAPTAASQTALEAALRALHRKGGAAPPARADDHTFSNGGLLEYSVLDFGEIVAIRTLSPQLDESDIRDGAALSRLVSAVQLDELDQDAEAPAAAYPDLLGKVELLSWTNEHIDELLDSKNPDKSAERVDPRGAKVVEQWVRSSGARRVFELNDRRAWRRVFATNVFRDERQTGASARADTVRVAWTDPAADAGQMSWDFQGQLMTRAAIALFKTQLHTSGAGNRKQALSSADYLIRAEADRGVIRGGAIEEAIDGITRSLQVYWRHLFDHAAALHVVQVHLSNVRQSIDWYARHRCSPANVDVTLNGDLTDERAIRDWAEAPVAAAHDQLRADVEEYSRAERAYSVLLDLTRSRIDLRRNWKVFYISIIASAMAFVSALGTLLTAIDHATTPSALPLSRLVLAWVVAVISCIVCLGVVSFVIWLIVSGRRESRRGGERWVQPE